MYSTYLHVFFKIMIISCIVVSTELLKRYNGLKNNKSYKLFIYIQLMRPDGGETAAHGCHCLSDKNNKNNKRTTLSVRTIFTESTVRSKQSYPRYGSGVAFAML